MTQSQQFNLRWNNHTTNMIQVIADQFERENLVDVTLSCEGKFLKSHKLVLSACSPYFQDIFDQHGSTPHPVIIMNGFKFDDLRSIVEFMYKGEVKVCESDLEGLLATAEGLQIKGLSNVRASKSQSGQSSPPQNSSSSSNAAVSNNGNANTSSSTSSTDPVSRGSNSHSSSNSGNNGNPVFIFNTNSSSGTRNLSNSHLNHDATEAGTPLHLRRKRRKTVSSHKETNESNSEFQRHTGHNNNGNIVDDDVNDDLPMTIKVDPPYIRDIDEDDDGDWDSATNKDSESVDAVSESKAGILEPKEKIPRPPNAFMIFANEWRRKLATQNPNESNKEISVRLGVMWKNLSGDSKEEYFAASRQANEDHKKKYPDYYYSPKEARMRKRWKMQQQQVSHLVSTGQYNPVHLVKVFLNDDGEPEGNNKLKPSTLQASTN